MTYRERGSRESPFYMEAFGTDDFVAKKAINYYEACSSKIVGSDTAQAGSYLNKVWQWGDRDEVFIGLRNEMSLAIREVQIQGQYLADLVQAKSTLQLISKDLLSCLKAVKSLTRPDIRKIKKFVSSSGKTARKNMSKVPASWLKFNFVYATTAMSVRDFAAIMDNPFAAVTFFKRFKDKAPSRYPDSVIDYNKIEYTAKGNIRIQNAAQNMIASLGITDFVGTIWELLPWSWAADYFANIGDWLGNLPGRFANLLYEDWYTGYKADLFHVLPEMYYNAPAGVWDTRHYDVWCSSYNRSPGFPGSDVELEFQLGPSLRQSTYLMSAIALTLKGKFR